MNILVITDDDGIKGRLPALRAETLISCGDVNDAVILHSAAACRARKIFAVKGNHDSHAAFPAPIVDLHRARVEFEGLTFGGFAGSWKYKPRGPHLFEQDEAAAALAEFPRVDVFVAHNSPRLVHDRDDGVHTGFVAFNDYIRRSKPRWFLHGHQHVQQETVVEGTRVMGSYGFRLLVLNK
jgi:Icc-related predicted phosphoesterase